MVLLYLWIHMGNDNYYSCIVNHSKELWMTDKNEMAEIEVSRIVKCKDFTIEKETYRVRGPTLEHCENTLKRIKNDDDGD